MILTSNHVQAAEGSIRAPKLAQAGLQSSVRLAAEERPAETMEVSSVSDWPSLVELVGRGRHRERGVDELRQILETGRSFTQCFVVLRESRRSTPRMGR